MWDIEDPSKVKEIEFPVGTGSAYMVLPHSLLMELGVRLNGRRRFRVADGRVIGRELVSSGLRLRVPQPAHWWSSVMRMCTYLMLSRLRSWALRLIQPLGELRLMESFYDNSGEFRLIIAS